jgi:hypothetical protein
VDTNQSQLPPDADQQAEEEETVVPELENKAYRKSNS